MIKKIYGKDFKLPSNRSYQKDKREQEVKYSSIDDVNRTIECIYATESPYSKYFDALGDTYEEILVHQNNKNINIDRLNNSAPLLYNHDTEMQIGKVERAWVSGDTCCAIIRFANYSHIPFIDRTELQKKTEETWEMVKQGIRNNISFGYEYELGNPIHAHIDDINKKIFVKQRNDIEISIVNIPADPNAEFRSKKNINTQTSTQTLKMPDQDKNEDFIKMLPGIIGMKEHEVEEEFRKLNKNDEDLEENLKNYRDIMEDMDVMYSMMKADMSEEETRGHLMKMKKEEHYIDGYMKYKAIKNESEQAQASQNKDKQGSDGTVEPVYPAERGYNSNKNTKNESSEILSYANQKGIEDSVAVKFIRSKSIPTLAQFKEQLLEDKYKQTSKYTVDNKVQVTRELDKKNIAVRAISLASGDKSNVLRDKTEESAASSLASNNRFSDVLNFMEVDGGMKVGENGNEYMYRVYNKAMQGDPECSGAVLSVIKGATEPLKNMKNTPASSLTREMFISSLETAKREYKGVSSLKNYNIRNLTSSDLGISTASVDQADVPFIAPQWPDMFEAFNARPFISKEPRYDAPNYINIKYNAALFKKTPELSRPDQMQQLNYATLGTMFRAGDSLDYSWEALLADDMNIIQHMLAQFTNGYELARNSLIGSYLFGINPDTNTTFTPTYQRLTKVTQQNLPDFSSAQTFNIWSALPSNNIDDPAANQSNWLDGCDLNITNYNLAVKLMRKQAFTLNQGGRIIPFKFEPQYLVVHQDDYERALNIFKEVYPIIANVDPKVFSPANPSTPQGLAQGLSQPLAKIPILTYREGDFNIIEGTGDHSWFITSVPTQVSAFYDLRWERAQGINVQNRFINEELRFATSAYAYIGIGFGVPQAIIRATPTNDSPFRSGNERGEEVSAIYNESKRKSNKTQE